MVTNLPYTTRYREPVPALANASSIHFIGKRVFDIAFAAVVTVLILIWMIPLVGLLISATSPGPPLFIQWRTGRNHRAFRCLKFRTMYHQPEGAFRQATRNDKRVTRIGDYLRRTNLDEMPQFLNVLVGDMSIVGPRPHAVQHDQQCWHLPGYRDRYVVRPGITGLAQVRGFRGETTEQVKMQHRVRLDRYYIRKATLGLDLYICWQTVKQMVRGNINAW